MKFIFKIKIKEGHTEQEYLSAWKNGSTLIQKSLGARGTKLYRKIGEPGTLIAIAEWESKELRDAAMDKLDQEPREIQEIRNKHKEFADIEILGNFEQVEKIDPPA